MRLSKLHTLACLALLAGCSNENEKASPLHPEEPPPRTADFAADTAVAWFDLALDAIRAESLNPPEASRRLGYAGVALYEAVVGGMSAHRSLGEQLNGLAALPAPPRADMHWAAAASAALAEALTGLFADASPATLQTIADRAAALEAQFAGEVEAAVLTRSLDFGQVIGAAILAWSTTDGYALFDDCPTVVPVGDGLWQPTPPAFVAAPLEPCWGLLRPFVLLFGAECAPLPPPAFSRQANTPFALEAQEVYDTANGLTQEQADIATFWADGPGSITPPGHWIAITSQVLVQEGKGLDVAAEAYAKVGIALADAFISCWEIKYAYDLLRPITYVRDPAGPIQDPLWTSFVTTPPFPEYTSGHSTQSAAAAAVLTDLLGPVVFTDHTHDDLLLAPRSFDSFAQAADEAAISRLYGGIHFRSGVRRGLEQGACVARLVLNVLHFRE